MFGRPKSGGEVVVIGVSSRIWSTFLFYVSELFTCNLADPSIVDDTVAALETTVEHLVVVHVLHSSADVLGKRETETPEE